ncbi:MAG: MarR family transcriptional regulator [Chloroflexi bacterium]|nr:MarR family transcriptional regulator [Chloroflexota bacterium]
MSDDVFMAAWVAFLRAHAAVLRPLERELQAECDLPLTWYDVLVQLSAAPGGRLRMQQLAKAVLLSKSRITRLVEAMEQAGLLVREPCPDDKRGAEVAPTATGQARLCAAAPVHLRGIRQHFTRHLSQDQAAVLAQALSGVAAAEG